MKGKDQLAKVSHPPEISITSTSVASSLERNAASTSLGDNPTILLNVIKREFQSNTGSWCTITSQ